MITYFVREFLEGRVSLTTALPRRVGWRRAILLGSR